MKYYMNFFKQKNLKQKNFPYYKIEIELHKGNTIIKIDTNSYYKVCQFRTLANYFEIDINKENTKADMKNECLRINMSTNEESTRFHVKITDFKIANGDGRERIVFENEVDSDFELEYNGEKIDGISFINNFFNNFIYINNEKEH